MEIYEESRPYRATVFANFVISGVCFSLETPKYGHIKVKFGTLSCASFHNNPSNESLWGDKPQNRHVSKCNTSTAASNHILKRVASLYCHHNLCVIFYCLHFTR